MDVLSVENSVFLFLLYLISASSIAYPDVSARISSDLRYFMLWSLGIAGIFLGMRFPHILKMADSQKKYKTFIKDADALFYSQIYLILSVFVFYFKIKRIGVSAIDYFQSSVLLDHISNYLARDTFLENTLTRLLFIVMPFGVVYFERLLLKGRIRVAVVYWFGFILIPLILTSATRMGLIIAILFWVAYRHCYVKRMNLAMVLPLGLLFLTLGTYGNFLRGGVDSSKEKISQEFVLHTFEKDLSPVFGLDILYKTINSGLIEYENGMDLVYFIGGFIPRLFWLEKPITAFEPRWTINLIGEIGHEHGVLTFMTWGVGFAQFGLVGAFLYSFVYGCALTLLITGIQRVFQSHLFSFYCTFLFAVGVRSSVQFILFMSVLYFILPIIIYNYRRRGK